jgi:hypothetical protein
MSMKPITREDLDGGTCEEPGCTCGGDEVYLGPMCHYGAGMHAAYVKSEGAFRLECAECGLPIAMIAVATRSFLQ